MDKKNVSQRPGPNGKKLNYIEAWFALMKPTAFSALMAGQVRRSLCNVSQHASELHLQSARHM